MNQPQRLAAELLRSLPLAATVIGSGNMAGRLAGGRKNDFHYFA
jgi:hypothetical protein